MKVLGRRVLVKRSKRRKEDLCGMYYESPQPTIWINTRYSKATQARTLVHEYFHALYAQVQDPDDEISEEIAARLFETGLSDLWFNNREMITSLSQEESEDGKAGKIRDPEKGV